MAAMASLTQKEHLSKWVIRASENETELMVNKANVRKYRILYILFLSFVFGGWTWSKTKFIIIHLMLRMRSFTL